MQQSHGGAEWWAGWDFGWVVHSATGPTNNWHISILTAKAASYGVSNGAYNLVADRTFVAYVNHHYRYHAVIDDLFQPAYLLPSR